MFARIAILGAAALVGGFSIVVEDWWTLLAVAGCTLAIFRWKPSWFQVKRALRASDGELD